MLTIATWLYNVAGTGLQITTGVPMVLRMKAQIMLEKTGLAKVLIYLSNKYKALVGIMGAHVTAAFVLTFMY